MRMPGVVGVVALLLLLPAGQGWGQATDETPLSDLLDVYDYRMVGPYRGGRVTAVTGVVQSRGTFYMGATGGGVWKTNDYGLRWENVSDGFFETGAIGALDVANSDPNVVYAGTGSACIRSNIVTGRGVYRSTDAGRTWTFLGLRESGAIGDLVVHPEDPDLVYVAALGHIFGPNEERGVYRSRDGGETWERVLEGSERTGAVDLSLDPSNPRRIFASLWRAERKPWTILSGGDRSGLFLSRDGGDTWSAVTEGLPEGPVGKVAVEISPANPQRVWALVEAEGDARGLYRSDDGGESFEKVNSQISLTYRPWYYMHLAADPKNENKLFVHNETLWVSLDGGRNFEALRTPHGDNHAHWIHPDDPDLMVQGNDGGANVSQDGGLSWSMQWNQPTAELYQVAVDNGFPYRLYGAQQDNSTISVPSRITRRPLDPKQNWLEVSGCETGPVVPDPRDPRFVYGGCKGRHSVFDTETGQTRQYWVYPHFNYGHQARDMPYRFQRTAPMIVSPHDPEVIYHASHVLHRSSDLGQTWEVISPDLTENDPEFQGYSGGPITRDITGEEIYSAIYAVAESPLEKGVLFVGANDGPIHVSRDDGETWNEVTPSGLPEGGRVNRIEASRHVRGRAYVAVYRYMLDDWRPYLYRADDYGQSWTLLTDGENGIPADSPVRVVREDPVHAGLLYVGTEFGLHVSFDGGETWTSLQENLPAVPVTDLVLHEGDLVVSTMGRSFWILDDLQALREWHARGGALERVHLFAPRTVHRANFVGSIERQFGGFAPEYPEPGARIVYRLGQKADRLELEVLDADGEVVRQFVAAAKSNGPLHRAPGVHDMYWDLRAEAPRTLTGRGNVRGPKVVPGRYTVRLTALSDGQETSREVPLEVRLDPRVEDAGVTLLDLQAQYELSLRVRDAMDLLRREAAAIEFQQQQIDLVLERDGIAAAVVTEARSLREALEGVRGLLLQTQEGKVGAELEPQLEGQLTYLYGMLGRADQRPGADAEIRLADIEEELGGVLVQLAAIRDGRLAQLNRMLAEAEVPVISPSGFED